MLPKIKKLNIKEGQKVNCTISIGSFIEEGLFRINAIFDAYLEKKSEATSISFLTDPPNEIKLTLTLRSFYNIVSTTPTVYYVNLRSRPTIYKHEQISSSKQWTMHDINIYNTDQGYIADVSFSTTLAIKICFETPCELFDSYIDYAKIDINAEPVCEIYYTDYPCPDYDSIFFSINSWEAKYMILVFITNYQLYLKDLTMELVNLINSSEDSDKILEDIFYEYTVLTTSVFQNYIENQPSSRRAIMDENKISVRRVRFLPSAIVFEPPEIDVSNRVVRKYNFPEYYIRISMENENNEKRVWNNCKAILRKFEANLRKLRIIDRDYEFLGFSNSQMREHSCWMLCNRAAKSADQIRSELGDFSGCKNNSKYASRLGLCFSATYRTIQIQRKLIEDVKRNNYVFTDGVGKISIDGMKQAKQKLNIPDYETVCALQVRIGGCKGVLTLNTECSGVEVRPSMDKFKSNAQDLEVCSISGYRQGYLNRQIILLLSGRGVRDDTFIRLQRNTLSELDLALSNETYSISLLGGHEKDIVLAGIKFMLDNGLKICDEPYLQRMLQALYQSKVSDIKKKARIPAPNSLILLGVVDEYELLEYGEVFIFPSRAFEFPITGEIVVAKNPCLHPGDIRVLKAVDIPQLHYLRDVLVFPQKGDRPHPNECSGSDLDGDMYFVSWNVDLIPLIKYENPMDYTPYPEKEEQTSIDGVIEFFINYMESENLGNIANTHLSLADRHGIYHHKVLKLAELHSQAVDYPKTGVPAIIPPDHRVRDWPDYMEKDETKSYKSEHVIGKLYREIKEKDVDTFKPLADERFLEPGHQSWLKCARNLYKDYSREIRKLMRQYDAKDEFYLLTYQPGDKVGRHGKSENKIKMQDFVKDLIKSILFEFHSVTNSDEERRLLASACYSVSYKITKKKGKIVSKYISFPWIFYEYLI